MGLIVHTPHFGGDSIAIGIWVILLKNGKSCDIERKNSECDFWGLLFGNEILISLVYIRHKLTG